MSGSGRADQPVAIRYAPLVSVPFFAMAIFGVIMGVVDESTFGLVASGWFAFGGIALFLGKRVVVHPHEVQFKSPLGFTGRRRPINGFDDLVLDRQWLIQRSTGRRIVGLGYSVRFGDVAALRKAIASALEESPPTQSSN